MTPDTQPEDGAQDLLKQTELSLKQVELKLKERELSQPRSALTKLRVSPVEATIFVGVLAFLGSLTGTYIQDRNKLALEQQKQEAALALDALKGPEPTENLNRLVFLIDSGFITDKNGAIRALVLSGKYGLVAAPSSPTLLDAMANQTLPPIIKQIADEAQVSLNLPLREVNDFAGIATIVVDRGTPTLVYDKTRIRDFDPTKSNSWTTVAVLAHEIGHVVLKHTEGQNGALCFAVSKAPGTSSASTPPCKGNRDRELEADRFSGRILRRLGASLSQAEQALALLSEEETPTHPGRKDRVQELLRGWSH